MFFLHTTIKTQANIKTKISRFTNPFISHLLPQKSSEKTCRNTVTTRVQHPSLHSNRSNYKISLYRLPRLLSKSRPQPPWESRVRRRAPPSKFWKRHGSAAAHRRVKVPPHSRPISYRAERQVGIWRVQESSPFDDSPTTRVLFISGERGATLEESEM